MKKTLLSTILLTSIGASAQTVNSFYTESEITTDYYLLESDSAPDETPSGENAQWSFDGFTSYGNSQTSVLGATTDQETAYPGTTSVVETSGDFDTTQFFLANGLAGQVSLTATNTAGTILNYSTDNAYLGTFPMSFSDNVVTDDIAGTFESGELAGTFSGTCVTSVDGYGTLTGIGGDGDLPVVYNVTRLKIEQNITLYYVGINLGTVTEVMYNYFVDDSTINGPIFRTLSIAANIPMFGIDSSEQSIESYYAPTAGLETFVKANFSIVPNPVQDVLHFEGNASIKNITVTDINGKQVLTAAANDVNINGLTQGVYIVTAQTENGTFTQKIVKQ